jgi:hypothetical protein
MAVEWYYTTNKQQMGPVTWAELRELADVGILKPHDMVWSDGMDEWVKAINQSGLFSDGDGDAGITTKKKFKPGKPPPGRRTRRLEEEDEDDEDDVSKERRDNRKRAENRYKTGVGIRIVLTLLGVGLLLFLLVGCVGVLIWAAWPGGGGGGGGGPRPPMVGGMVRDNFAWNGIGEGTHLEKVYRFSQGRRVVVTVTNTLPNPNTNVDLMIFRGNEQNQKNAFVADRRPPQQDRNCRVEFIVPNTENFRIRVANFGPGVANCQVSVEEQ